MSTKPTSIFAIDKLTRITSVSLVSFFCFMSFSTGNVLAAPSINSVNGSLVHGQSVTFSGSEFGTKSPATPLLWDNFSRGTSGQPLSTGAGSPWKTAVSCVGTYSNKMKYGQNSLSASQVLVSDKSCWTRTNVGLLGEQSKIFSSYHYYVVPGGTGTHTKMGRVGCGDDVHCTPNMGYTAFSPNYWYAFADSASEKVIARVNGVEGQWFRDDTWSTLSSDGVANGTVGVWRNGVEQGYDTAVLTKNASSTSKAYNQVFLPYYNEAGNRTVYVGDIYVDNTLARVEICSGSTWAKRGTCEIQIPTAWNSGSATVTVNQGAFANSSNQYLYVIDSTGAANTNGYAISFGGTPSTALSAPLNLKVTAN